MRDHPRLGGGHPALVLRVAAYEEFYESPGEPAAIEAFCRALLSNPQHEGVQLLARDAGGAAAIRLAAGEAPYEPLATIDELYPERPDR